MSELFETCKQENRAALMPYLTVGLPTPADSVGLFAAMADEGADAFEVGIPYADPLMDGPTIQEAGERAIRAGSGVEVGLDLLAEIVAATGKPCTVMTYVNPVLRMGIDVFSDRVAAAGGSAVIIADLPVDEAEPFSAAFTSQGLGLVLFVAPTTTKERLERVVAADPPFVYGVSELGVTGMRSTASSHIGSLVARVHQQSDVPVVAGVGISTPDQARTAATAADGVIVGSALVRRVLDAEDTNTAADALRHAVHDLADAVRRTN